MPAIAATHNNRHGPMLGGDQYAGNESSEDTVLQGKRKETEINGEFYATTSTHRVETPFCR